MKKGDTTEIYQDPITRLQYEGEATLLKCLDDDMGWYEGEVLQHWQVQFDGNEEFPVNRYILVKLAPAGDEWPDYYQDTGCKFFPSCLNCPLPQCLYDNPALVREHQVNEHTADNVKLYKIMQSEGLSVEQAAVRFNVTVRTIYRRVRSAKEWEALAS